MVQLRILIASILLGFSSLLGHAEGHTCNEDYRTLANALLKTSDNQYQLSIAFYPTNRAPPAFVKVIYRYDNTNITDQEWLWSAGAFYFFQPLRIYQFTSLFFGNPEFRSSTVILTLPANCSDVPAALMETLTQRLKLIASTSEEYPKITDMYQAKATNETSVNKSFYNRDNHDILSLIHTAQVLFPFFSTLLLVACFVYWWCVHRKDSRPPSNEDWSTLAAYYGVSFYFTLFVWCLDWVVVHHTVQEQLFVIENNLLKRLAVAPTVFDSVSLFFIVCIIPLNFIRAEILYRARNSKDIKCKKECLGGLTSTDGKDVKYTKLQFIWLSTAGFSPFLCITSHAHFILIAWITDPSYAFGIGVFYGISFFVYFVTFKFLYYEFVRLWSYCSTCCKEHTCSFCTDTASDEPPQAFSCLGLLLILAVGLIVTAYIAMIACFFVYIPISKSIEDTPTQVYAIYQGIIVVLTVLLSYVVVAKRGSSFINKGVKIALKKAQNISKISKMTDQKWMKISDEERLAGVLTTAVEDYITQCHRTPNINSNSVPAAAGHWYF